MPGSYEYDDSADLEDAWYDAMEAAGLTASDDELAAMHEAAAEEQYADHLLSREADAQFIDRRTNRVEVTNNMAHILKALEGIAMDAEGIANGSLLTPVGFDIARRASALKDELSNFRARDLINMRESR